jgi:hypothetical protein
VLLLEEGRTVGAVRRLVFSPAPATYSKQTYGASSNRRTLTRDATPKGLTVFGQSTSHSQSLAVTCQRLVSRFLLVDVPSPVVETLETLGNGTVLREFA